MTKTNYTAMKQGVAGNAYSSKSIEACPECGRNGYRRTYPDGSAMIVHMTEGCFITDSCCLPNWRISS